jgi:BolA protein
MDVQHLIESKLNAAFSPQYLAVENESHRHSGPATDSHFKLTVVSAGFAGLSPVKRHQAVYAVLREELAGGVHALALHTHTPEEWQAKSGSDPDSPQCRGGSKAG